MWKGLLFMNKNRARVLVAACACCVVLAIVAVILFVGKEEKNGTKIGFIMTGSSEEHGWNGMHYDAVKAACEKLGGKLFRFVLGIKHVVFPPLFWGFCSLCM